MASYVDTPALVKLVVAESETAALRSWLENADRDLVLRSLGAVHLAAASDLGDELEGLVTYGDRLTAAAVADE